MDTSEDGNIITMAAMNRPFRVGMLYDCRIEELLHGLSLWDDDILRRTMVQRLDCSDFEVHCSDSFDKKAEALDMSGPLKLSFLSGLLSLDGSGKYLADKKTSSQHQQVTLQYKCTTRVESLTMKQLGEGRIQHPEMFCKATHVVTSVTYGAQAFFIFDVHRDDMPSDSEKSGEGRLGGRDGENYTGLLENIVKKISGMKFDGKGKGTWTKHEEELIKKCQCRFYGDFMLPKNLSSFEDAEKAYETLFTLRKGRIENVPVKVQLYPLSKIDDTASKLVQDISTQLINSTEKFFEDMNKFDMKCNDLLKFHAVKCFTDIQHQIKDFMHWTKKYRGILQKDFRELLLQVRGGTRRETSIAELLRNISTSPFSRESLRSWLETKEADIKVLSEFTQTLSDIRSATEPGDVKVAIMSPHTKYCLCIVFSLPSHASQLRAMQDYCVGKYTEGASAQSVVQKVSSKLSMKEVACIFKDFYNANKANREVSFIVAQEFSECSTLHARIQYYKNGEKLSSNYELPSAPERVKVLVEDTTYDSLTISWKAPQYGASAITSYVVSCQNDILVTPSCTVSPENNRVTITGLAEDTEYKVQVCGMLEVGQSPFGEAEQLVQTNPSDYK